MAGELGSFNSAGMLAIVGFLAGSYLIGRIGGLLLAHLPNESTRTDTAFSIVRQILYAGILVGPILISGTYWIDTSLPVVSQTVVGKILTGALFLTILTGIGAWLVNQSLQPAAKKHYGPKPSLDSTIRWYGRLVPAGAFFVFAMYLHVLMNNPTSYHLAGLLFLTVFLWPAVKFATMPVPSQHFTLSLIHI